MKKLECALLKYLIDAGRFLRLKTKLLSHKNNRSRNIIIEIIEIE